jgi:hypothetical protein
MEHDSPSPRLSVQIEAAGPKKQEANVMLAPVPTMLSNRLAIRG